MENKPVMSRVLHYFSDWIKDNEQKGIVHERTGELGLAGITNLEFGFYVHTL